MIKILNQQREPLAILENAYNKSLEREVNHLWYFSFSLPITDEKNTHCEHYNYVEVEGKSGRNYGLYRIMPIETKKHDGYIRYTCEHVLATLLDSVIVDFQQYVNVSTRTVLESLLAMQDEAHWVLGACEFELFIQYGFENENGLLAPILSVPKPFAEPYEFTFDTTVYPFVLNLVKASDEAKSEYRWGKNILEFEELADPTEIVNWIIPKGYGEGVNQLTIASVNNGLKYLKDDESIAKWGKKPYIWIDRRFENPESLKKSGQSLLNQWKEAKFSFTCKAVDLSILPEYAHERRFLNTVSNVIVGDKTYKARITGERIRDLDKEYDVDYTLGNKLDDIATTNAEYERKIQVNEAYSQGATNIDTYSYNDNADAENPAVIRFYLPEELVNINKLELTYEVDSFRAYSKATKGGGALVDSTASGGGSSQTSSSGGGVSTSTTSGGGTSQTSSSGGNHTHLMFSYVGDNDGGLANPERDFVPQGGTNFRVTIPAAAPADLITAGGSGDHTHSVSVPAHTHDFSTPNHSHSVTIPNHQHSITLPDHTHGILYGIYKEPVSPNSVTVKVDGNAVNDTGDRINIIPYLSKDEGGKVLRGQWHEVAITPSGLGRINANIFGQYFLQSRGGGTY